MSKFEYHEPKSSSNNDKHGIDFEEAQQIWGDRKRVEIPSSVTEDEKRFIVIGKIGAKHWSAVITYRNDIIRIISVRRARDKEVKVYESG